MKASESSSRCRLNQSTQFKINGDLHLIDLEQAHYRHNTDLTEAG